MTRWSRQVSRERSSISTSVAATPAAEYANKLSEGGCDIGGHTQTRGLLNALLPNEVFYEILANRVRREVDTQRPIDGFASSPGGVWNDSKIDPTAPAAITIGHSRGLSSSLPRFRPQQPVHATRHNDPTSHQVSPAITFRSARLLQTAGCNSSARDCVEVKQSYSIRNSIHAHKQGAELEKLKEGFRHYAGNPEWWYCTMTDYAAYARNAANTQIVPDEPVGTQRTYHITRPVPAELGSDVPMTVEVSSAAVTSASGDGFKVGSRDARRSGAVDVSPM